MMKMDHGGDAEERTTLISTLLIFATLWVREILKEKTFPGSIHQVVTSKASNLENALETNMVRTSPVTKKTWILGFPKTTASPTSPPRLSFHFFHPRFCWELHWELDIDPRLQPHSHVRSRPRWCTHPRKRWCHLCGKKSSWSSEIRMQFDGGPLYRLPG